MPTHRVAVSSSYGLFGSSLRDLPWLRRSRRGRESSWDPSGGNRDWVTLQPGASLVMADIAGPGSINHLWMTIGSPLQADPIAAREPAYLRQLVLRMTWDDEPSPSVLAPVGDFFGVGFGETTVFESMPLQMSPQDGRGFNAFFHMPFASRARLELISELDHDPLDCFFYVDYERFDALEDGLGRFHAQWRREHTTSGVAQGPGESNASWSFGGDHPSVEGNYTILDATGHGHYVGCVLNWHNLRETDDWNWYGEGDDMIVIDDEPWPPRLHGTGTEDYFNTAWSPDQAFHAPYHGLTLPGGPNWSGRTSMYRFHIEDPVVFERSIHVSIEHGHANKRSDDLSSVAYWYQAEPHAPFSLAPVAERIPRPR